MQPPPLPPVMVTPARRRLALFLKLAGIVGLILLLHIPVLLTNGVLQERRGYRQQAVGEIAGIWGREQRITGPLLAVPYVVRKQVIRSKVVEGKAVAVEETVDEPATVYFLPEELTVNGPVEPETRHRGIYDVVVFGVTLKLSGYFKPDFGAAGIEADRVEWEKTSLLFGVSDLRGVRAISPCRLKGGKEVAFESTDSGAGRLLPLQVRLEGAAPGVRLDFAFDASVQGSERLQIAPVGKATTAALTSAWPDPSFCGAYLPIQRQVGAAGFRAAWTISHFSRGFPQSWSSRASDGRQLLQQIDAAGFGVAFAQPVDGYRLAERAQKYALLFFVLVFAVFFLFEVTAGLRIHWLQYGLVGAGLCLFFLGFLALSEFMAVGVAYGLAAAASTALVSLYAWSFLKTGRRTLLILGGLSATYGYLYFVLRSQDYALLAGTAALFATLALVMYGTRRVNWYALELGAPKTPAGSAG
jgi:inner membrane protein